MSVKSLLRQIYLRILCTFVSELLVFSSVLIDLTMFKKVTFGRETIMDKEKKLNNTKHFVPFKDGKVQVYPDTMHPHRAWEKLQVKQTVHEVAPMSHNTSISVDKVRIVCISDTHNRTISPQSIPDGDILIHAGDFSMVGQPSEIEQFNTFLSQLPHKHKVVIAGNHDLTFDPKFLEEDGKLRRFGLDPKDVCTFLEARNLSRMSDVLTNCTYLEDAETKIYGIRIYGSPWQPWFGDWGFNLTRGADCLEKWDKIPEGIDILITHGPPIGHGDYCSDKNRAGCVELLHTIQHRVKPKYHIFGHIHEAYGITTDGETCYINASTCTLRYRATNPAIIFDVPLPEGFTKDIDN